MTNLIFLRLNIFQRIASRGHSYQTFFYSLTHNFVFFAVKLGHLIEETQFVHMLQTLKLNSKNRQMRKTSLVGLAPGANPIKLCFSSFSDFRC